MYLGCYKCDSLVPKRVLSRNVGFCPFCGEPLTGIQPEIPKGPSQWVLDKAIEWDGPDEENTRRLLGEFAKEVLGLGEARIVNALNKRGDKFYATGRSITHWTASILVRATLQQLMLVDGIGIISAIKILKACSKNSPEG